MDIEKMIEQFRTAADKWEAGHQIILTGELRVQDALRDAATALSTLKAENESLKEKLYDGEGVNLVDYWMQQAKIEENGHRNCQAENEKLRAELEQVKRDLDAAVKDMEALMWFSGEGCHICAHEIVIHKEPYVRSECALGNGAACCPTWRGRKEG